jgi:hypothetical protein
MLLVNMPKMDEGVVKLPPVKGFPFRRFSKAKEFQIVTAISGRQTNLLT